MHFFVYLYISPFVKASCPRGRNNSHTVNHYNKTNQPLTWHLHTTSTSVASMSTTLPLPSSPHWAPRITVTAFWISVRGRFRGDPFPFIWLRPFTCTAPVDMMQEARARRFLDRVGHRQTAKRLERELVWLGCHQEG